MKYADDALVGAGITCITIGAFLFHPVAGWVVLGLCLAGAGMGIGYIKQGKEPNK